MFELWGPIGIPHLFFASKCILPHGHLISIARHKPNLFYDTKDSSNKK